MSGLRYPNINAASEREQLNQIKSYLRQLVDNLNHEMQSIPEQEVKKTEQTVTAAKGAQTPVAEILQAAMPVGHIYISVSATNPSAVFGFGTWEQMKDTFLLAAGDTYAAGTTGGEAEHTLTKEELPNYDLSVTVQASKSGLADYTALQRGWSDTLKSIGSGGVTVKSGGSDLPHNNMPPYTTVYVWKRVS